MLACIVEVQSGNLSPHNHEYRDENYMLQSSLFCWTIAWIGFHLWTSKYKQTYQSGLHEGETQQPWNDALKKVAWEERKNWLMLTLWGRFRRPPFVLRRKNFVLDKVRIVFFYPFWQLCVLWFNSFRCCWFGGHCLVKCSNALISCNWDWISCSCCFHSSTVTDWITKLGLSRLHVAIASSFVALM